MRKQYDKFNNLKRLNKRDKKISILKKGEIIDEEGFSTTGEVIVADNIWAYYRQASGSEFYGAAVVNIKVEAIFEIVWRNDIDERCKIRYKGNDYNITRIDDFEGRKSTLRIYAYRIK